MAGDTRRIQGRVGAAPSSSWPDIPVVPSALPGTGAKESIGTIMPTVVSRLALASAIEQHGDGHPLNRQIRSVVATGSTGAGSVRV